MQLPTCLIDDFGPLPVQRPENAADLGDLVRRAAAERRAVYPVGGRTMLGLGLPPERPGVAVDLLRLDRVVDYPARDMTVTVQAGITLANLQAVLAAEHQRLPVDVPQPERATLGGAVAANVSGPRRYGWGTLRDYVLGVSAVTDAGHEVKGGGRVVKNVAGYDLCKLLVGSLGTLGVVTQVTLKVRPRPEEQALLTLGCKTEAVPALLDLLHQSRTRPVCVELLNARAVLALNRAAAAGLPEAPWVLVAGFEDSRAAVAWQVRQLVQEVPAQDGWGLEVRAGATSAPLWRALADFPAWPAAKLSFRANLLPHAAAEFCRQMAILPEDLLLQAHAGSGVVVGHVEGDVTLERAAALAQGVLAAAAAGQGNAVLLKCPPAWKKALPVWVRPRGDAWLMRRVKEQLDPNRLFNPGRFVDGI
jgi:glycolate oxidase FAD binding subunit